MRRAVYCISFRIILNITSTNLSLAGNLTNYFREMDYTDDSSSEVRDKTNFVEK